MENETVLAGNREQLQQIGQWVRLSLIDALKAHYLDRPKPVLGEGVEDYDERVVDWLFDLDEIVEQYL